MAAFKRRQIVMLSLVLMVVVAGYISYNSKSKDPILSESKGGKVGEAVFVDSDDTIAKPGFIVSSEAEQNEKQEAASLAKSTESGDTASKNANDFFARAKLDRETSVSKDSDKLKSLSQDQSVSKEARDRANDQMIKVVQTSQKEMKIETLIREKGFNDAVVVFGEDGSLDIVVKAPTLDTTQVAQIADVASRHGNLSMNRIHVRNIY